jgi:hypothetical protein
MQESNNVEEQNPTWKTTCDLETPRFMIAIQDQIISTNNYKKHVLKDLNTINQYLQKIATEIRNHLAYNQSM